MTRFHWIMVGLLTLMAMCLFVIGAGISKAETIKPRPKPICATAGQLIAGLNAMGPPVRYSEIGAFGTGLFLSKYNLIPPVSNIVGDHMVIIETANDQKVFVTVFKGGCFDGFFATDRTVLRGIIRSV